MKIFIKVAYTFIIVIFCYQSGFGQNSLIVKGKVIDNETNKYLPGVIVESYDGENLINTTTTSIENGSFTYSTKTSIEKIKFSYQFYYPLIIENIDSLRTNELILNSIKLFQIPLECIRYADKKAEREGRKEEKKKFNKLKEGIIIDLNNRNYKMKLKKNKGKFAFHIDFKDSQNN